jgi:hypothetical protein
MSRKTGILPRESFPKHVLTKTFDRLDGYLEIRRGRLDSKMLERVHVFMNTYLSGYVTTRYPGFSPAWNLVRWL